MWRIFVKPRSETEDSQRHEYILNILLLSSIILSGAALLLHILNRWINYHSFHTGPLSVLILVFAGFLGLYALSRFGLSTYASLVLIAIYLAAGIYTAFISGVENPQVLLLAALIIVMSGILVGTRFLTLMTILVAGAVLITGNLQLHYTRIPSRYFRLDSLDSVELITYAITLVIIMIILWLHNREIERSLARAHFAEGALKNERDNLEITVAKRTQELKQAQMEKMIDLYRFAEFGRLTSGLLHDLVNPLTSVSVNLEQLNTKKRSLIVERALEGTKRMERFIEAARKQIQNQEVKVRFSATHEAAQVVDLLEYRARQDQIKLELLATKHVYLYGNPIKLHKLMTNLIINAIDSYDLVSSRRNRRVVSIGLSQEKGAVVLVVRDSGSGISKEHLPHIFEPFFTTKSVEKGTGIGLAMCKDIVEKDFEGTIAVESQKDHGTTFTITLAIKQS